MTRGTTLVETLTVMGVIGVLSALLFPVFSAVRARGRQAETIDNLHQIGLAIALYRQEGEGAGRDVGTAEEMGLPVPYQALYEGGRLSWDVGRCTSGRTSEDARFNGLQLMYMNGYPATWNKVVDRWHEASITIAAMCFSDPNIPFNSPHFEYHGIGVALAGNVKVVHKRGDWIDQSWWQH